MCFPGFPVKYQSPNVFSIEYIITGQSNRAGDCLEETATNLIKNKRRQNRQESNPWRILKQLLYISMRTGSLVLTQR